MATIATFTQDDAGNFNGAIKTLTLNVNPAILRKVEKDNDKAPDFRILAMRGGDEQNLRRATL